MTLPYGEGGPPQRWKRGVAVGNMRSCLPSSVSLTREKHHFLWYSCHRQLFKFNSLRDAPPIGEAFLLSYCYLVMSPLAIFLFFHILFRSCEETPLFKRPIHHMTPSIPPPRKKIPQTFHCLWSFSRLFTAHAAFSGF